jgi:uroporphyrinogen III methyltransferase/synthase
VVSGTVGDIARRCEDAGLGAPALVVVGEVARLRETLRWWDTGPLVGRRVLVTRAREQAGSVVAALSERGAEPVLFPAIEFAPPTDAAPLRAAVRALDGYDVAIFTSPNGVAHFFAALGRAGRDARAFGRARVVAIGPATAAALRERGICADGVPEEFRGEAAAACALGLLAAQGGEVAGRRALLARAEVARDALPAQLREAGVAVDVVPVYRTVPASSGDVAALCDALRAGQLDAVTFTSSSTVQNVCDALGPEAGTLLAPVVVASIGPVTSETARQRGLRVDVEARTFTVPGLLEALEAHYKQRAEP